MIPVTLGSIVLQAFEIPEKFGPLGGVQATATHDFPGGSRTVQTFGAFPQPLRWSGYLTGASAFDREQQIDRMRATGQVVVLRYGRFAWQGVVTDFQAEPGHQFLIPYRVVFEPISDLSGINTVPAGTTSNETTLNNALTGLNNQLSPGLRTLPLPMDLQGPVSDLTTDTQQGLLDGGGTVANIPASDQTTIESDATNVQTVALPIINGPDATQASPAIDASVGAQTVFGTVANPNPTVATINSVNPNLFSLSQQYYGDASQWQTIANANGLSDPQPLGKYNLTIPASPAPAPQ